MPEITNLKMENDKSGADVKEASHALSGDESKGVTTEKKVEVAQNNDRLGHSETSEKMFNGTNMEVGIRNIGRSTSKLLGRVSAMNGNMPMMGGGYHIPDLPVLMPQSYQRNVQNVHQAISGEASAIEFYTQLYQEAPDEVSREFVLEALNDERKHLKAFTDLYMSLTGTVPVVQITPVEYNSFKEGIYLAMKDELKAAHFYKDARLSATDPVVQDTFFLAMTDELEHATQFSFVYHL